MQNQEPKKEEGTIENQFHPILTCPEDKSIPLITQDVKEGKIFGNIECLEHSEHSKTISYEELLKQMENNKLNFSGKKCTGDQEHKDIDAVSFMPLKGLFACKDCSIALESGSLQNIPSSPLLTKTTNEVCLNRKEKEAFEKILNSENIPEEINSPELSKIREQYETFKQTYVENLQISKSKGINQIDNLIEHNLSLNNTLFAFVDSIFYTYDTLKSTKDYAVYQNYKDTLNFLNFNLWEYNDRRSLVDNIMTITEYLNDHIILSPKKYQYQGQEYFQRGGAVFSLCKLNDSLYAKGMYNPNNIEIIEYPSNKTISTLTGHTDAVWKLYVHKKTGYGLSLSYDNSIRVWDYKESKCIKEMKGHTGKVRSILEGSNGDLLTVSDDKSIIGWDSNFELKFCIHDVHNKQINDIIKLKDKEQFITVSSDQSIKIWNLPLNEGDKEVQKVQINIPAMCVIEKDDKLLIGSLFGSVIVFDLTTFNKICTCSHHKSSVFSIISLSDGTFASCSADHNIDIWDKRYQFMSEINGHGRNIYNSGIEMNNHIGISGAEDRIIKIWKRVEMKSK